MKLSNRYPMLFPVILILALAGLTSCALEQRPTLDEVRNGRVHGRLTEDTGALAGGTRAEIIEIDPGRRELRVQTDAGRSRVLTYDRNSTNVTYHGWDYNVEQLEAGDLIAFRTRPRNSDEVEAIRIETPVQGRSGSVAGRRTLPPQRSDVVEGTVERVQTDLGTFEVQPRSGRTVTVSVPYNARTADIESFRNLRRGDFVRVEGRFVNPDSLQLLSFLSASAR